MEKAESGIFPRWLFALLAIGGLLASGVYIGIMSLEGITGARLVQAAAYGVLGLLMFWGVLSRR